MVFPIECLESVYDSKSHYIVIYLQRHYKKAHIVGVWSYLDIAALLTHPALLQT